MVRNEVLEDERLTSLGCLLHLDVELKTLVGGQSSLELLNFLFIDFSWRLDQLSYGDRNIGFL